MYCIHTQAPILSLVAFAHISIGFPSIPNRVECRCHEICVHFSHDDWLYTHMDRVNETLSVIYSALETDQYLSNPHFGLSLLAAIKWFELQIQLHNVQCGRVHIAGPHHGWCGPQKSSTLHVVCSTLNVECSTLNVECCTLYIVFLRCNMQCATFNIRCATFNIQCATYNM